MPESVFESGGIYLDGGFDGGELGGRLQHPQLFDCARNGFQTNAHRLILELGIILKTDSILFKRQRVNAQALDPGGYLFEKGTLCNLQFTIRFLRRLYLVSRVREQQRAIFHDKQCTTASCETAQITDIWKRPNEECAGTGFPKERKQALAPGRIFGLFRQESTLWFQQEFTACFSGFQIAMSRCSVGQIVDLMNAYFQTSGGNPAEDI